MENLYSKMYEHYVQKCKEQKVDAKDIKFKFEVGKSYLDNNYGIYVRERDGKRVLVDWWYVDEDDGTFQKGQQCSWEWVYVYGDTETIHTGISDGAFVSAKCVMK